MDGTKRWSSPFWFHVLDNGKRIEGSIAVQFRSRRGMFDVENVLEWKLVTPGQVYESVLGCEYCLDEQRCVQGRLVVFKPSGDVKGPLTNGIGRYTAFRSYSANLTKYMAAYRPLFARCELSAPFPVANSGSGGDGIGLLRLVSNKQLELKVNPPPPVNFGSSSGKEEDVVCGRGVFGQTSDPVSILRFVEFYTQHWKFSRVILYNIGLKDFHLASELVEVIESGKLIVVDFTKELERLYGELWREVVLYSNNVYQNELKFDCSTRAKSLGARWTLHIDLDEYLFDSTNATTSSKFSTFGEYARSKFDDQPRHLSFAIQTIPHDQNKLCQCSNKFPIDQFVAEEAVKHADEIERFPGLPGPFHNTNGRMSAQRGKRKLLVRIDHYSHEPYEFNPWYIGVHQLRHCALVGNNGGECASLDLLGRQVDPLREMYIREFSCANREICQSKRFERWWT
ncbi:hypothetical protein BASA81_006393 [Batrachochytrium salamandrivorans]|nr:hypothetical protein BASA81_006393 [Batrachochytrium salamandrivorans]